MSPDSRTESTAGKPSVGQQFKSAAHELSVGLTPPILVGAFSTILAGGLGAPPDLAAFAGATAMFITFRLWLRHLTGDFE